MDKLPEKSDVYFHMIKITEGNKMEWQDFIKLLKKITPRQDLTIYNRDNSGKLTFTEISLTLGIDFLKILDDELLRHDLYIAYASKILNKTNNPPDWRDVECIVSVCAKEGIPYFTNMGIFSLAHIFEKKNYTNKNGYEITIEEELRTYLESIKYNYPAHKNISMYLFTFIAMNIQQFYTDQKVALFTSPALGFTDMIIAFFTKKN